MEKYIIIGSKPYNNIQLNNIIDTFKQNSRCNFSLPNNNNGTNAYEHILNCHMYRHFMYNIPKERIINRYKNDINSNKLDEFINKFNKNDYNHIYNQNINCMQKNILFNNFLKKINCPCLFSVQPRVGYNMIYYKLSENYNSSNLFIHGFSIKEEAQSSYYCKDKTNGLNYWHNADDEANILIWLHNNNYLDATMCSLEDEEVPTFDCSLIKPSKFILELFLNEYGICVLKNTEIFKYNINNVIIKRNKNTIIIKNI